MSDMSDNNSASRNGYPDYILQTPEISRIVRIIRYVSYVHLIFGFVRIFISEIFWAILESISLGFFGIYIFSKNSPLIHYLLYGLVSIFHLGCSTLLFYISFITWKIIRTDNIIESNMENNELGFHPQVVTRLKLSTFSHLVCGLLCIFSAYLINRLTRLIDNFNQLDVINSSAEQGSPIIHTNIPINSSYGQISNNYNVEAFSGIPVRLKDYPKANISV